MALLFITLNNETVQTKLVQRLTKGIEQKTGSQIEVGKLSFSFFSGISLENVFVSDNYNDTLLYVKKMRASISGFNLSSNNIRLRNVELEEPYFKIVSYKDNSMSLFTFIDALEGEEAQDSIQSPSSSFFSSANTTIKNGRFVYYDHDKVDIPYGMNYDDMDFRNINATVRNLRTAGSAIKMTIDSLTCTEKSGFRAIETKTNLTIDDGSLRLDDVHIKSPKSELNADYLDFKYTPGTGAWPNFVRAVIIDYMVTKSKINLEEVSLFNENLKGYDETLTASGHITGTVQNMRCENVRVKLYDDTKFSGNLSMNGLPNIDETFFDANILDFKTTLTDLEKIKIPNYEEGYLAFPEIIKKLGVFTYKGKYTGFISDFVFYGQFLSSYGNVKTDISLKPTTKTNQLEISGQIITDNFEIGKLIENKSVGKVSLNMNVVNAMANENYNSYAKIKGKVNKLELNDYPYQDINIDGYFADKVFDGNINMNNKHIAFDFKGNFDLHEEVPKTNFTLDLKHAQLGPLNLNMLSQDSTALTSFRIVSQLDGGSIDDATGEVKIYKLKYHNSKGNIATGDIAINSSLAKGKRMLNFKSKFADASLKGNYKISRLSDLHKRLISNYINIRNFSVSDSIVEEEQGELTLDLKNMNPLLDLFTDGYKISNNSKLFAHYKLGTTNSLELQFGTQFLKIKDQSFHNISLTTDGTSKLETILNIDRIHIAKNLNIIGFSMKNSVDNNTMQTNLDWGNKEILDYSGSLSIISDFKEIGNQKLSIKNTFLPSTFFLDGENWAINKSEIIVDSTDIIINKLKVSNKKETLEVDGIWSPTQDNAINVNLSSFDIGHIWNTIGDKDIKLSGKLSGYAKYKSINNIHTLASDLKIPNILVDNKNLGALTIYSDWNQLEKALKTEASLKIKGKDAFTIDGSYNIDANQMDYTASFNQFNLEGIKDFSKEYLNNLAGNINGNLTLKGTPNQFRIDGILDLKIPTITIAETGVTYHLNEQLKIQNNKINFKDFKLLDEKNKAAVVNGDVALGIGEKSKVNLKIKAKNLRILEDSYQPLAYGNARVTSDLNVTGDFTHVKVRGDISTDNNSKIIVPFDSASEVGDNDFITFINPADSLKYQESNDVLFIPTGTKSPVSFNVDFGINPTSEIQVLFESKSGSVLKSRGTANLFISRNRAGKQNIMGEYVVSQGTFFYSLENIVNKKFILQEGGTIRWNGAPEKAYVNLDAVYQLKTSVMPLLFQEGNATRQRQTTVLCKTHISGLLEDPKLTFEIEFPNLDSTTEGNVKAALQTTDLTKQMLSLLIFNKFTTPEYNPNIVGSNNGDALSVTTSELLSSQISNILSQISEDVNIGFIYRPGDDLTKEELGLAISTELLQNRVVISGNLGFSSQEEGNRFNDFVGDVDFDIKLNKKGNFRLRVFSHAKDNLYYYENKRNIQGAGFIYNEEFDTFKELINRYKEKLGWGKKKRKK